MSVILSKDGGTSGAYALVVDEIPADKAVQLQSDVTALVYGIDAETEYVDKPFSNAVLENFLVHMKYVLGNKLKAIKAIRCLTTLGLFESEQFVESVERQHGFDFNKLRVGPF